MTTLLRPTAYCSLFSPHLVQLSQCERSACSRLFDNGPHTLRERRNREQLLESAHARDTLVRSHAPAAVVDHTPPCSCRHSIQWLQSSHRARQPWGRSKARGGAIATAGWVMTPSRWCPLEARMVVSVTSPMPGLSSSLTFSRTRISYR